MKENEEELDEKSLGNRITADEEKALIQRIQEHPDDCEEAKAELILANRYFVRSIAQHLQKKTAPNIPLDELIAAGNEGIEFSAENFDLSAEYRFISYAVYFVRKAINLLIKEGVVNKNRLLEVSQKESATVEEEYALIKRIQDHPDDCEEAEARLLLVNRRFIEGAAEDWKRENSTNLSLDELIAQGNKGLLLAAKLFKLSNRPKFILFAIKFIKQSFSNNNMCY